MFLQPRQCVGYDFVGAAFNRLVSVFAGCPPTETGVVGIESSIKAGSCRGGGIEDHRADKSRGVVSPFTQNIGRVRQVLGQRYAKIINFMELGIRAGQDGGMRCRRQRNLGIGSSKDRRLAG